MPVLTMAKAVDHETLHGTTPDPSARWGGGARALNLQIRSPAPLIPHMK